MWRTLKCDKICKKVLKYTVEKNKKIKYNNNKNCSKRIVWPELNRTVCLTLVSVLL